MGVSDAFGGLTAVLEYLETTDAEVKNVEIGKQAIQERDEITANLTVGVPVLADDEFHDGISIRGDNVDLKDSYANIDLSVTLSVEESQRGYGSSPTSVGMSSERASSNAVPAYKDPNALRDVYEQYDTFPEMTEALGVDVTSETVRRYMVEYDIHDPSDTKQVRNHTDLDQNTPDPSSKDLAEESGSGKPNAAPSETIGGETTASFGEDKSAGSVEDGVPVTATKKRPASIRTENSDATTGTNGDGTGENSRDDAPEGGIDDEDPSEKDDTSVAELLAEANSESGDDSLMADGHGIPKGLTVGELTTIVNESSTVYEVKTKLGVNQDLARRLLKETALIDLVTQRLGAEQIRVSPREVRRRIAPNDQDSS
ncbi:hypothetical protein [Natrinema sp. DC36]|uniref:hypothetical protein n=1 Tax=Natrinema sp. DC36 TaxID=2878680 RepID=UPI001CF06DD8|nr:hypothetical protein [Natrinema sp. DC36]